MEYYNSGAKIRQNGFSVFVRAFLQKAKIIFALRAISLRINQAGVA